MRPFKRVSPSQINSYNDCPRLWWYQSVLGLETPQRPSAALGEAVHAQLEAYMDKGTLPDESTEAGSIAASGISLLPEPETCWTELKMHDDDIHFRWPPVVLSGIPVSGYIDLCDITVTPPLVLDHKCLPASAAVHTLTGPVRVGELSGRWECAAWDGNAIVSAEAIAPQPAGVQSVFSIRLKNGMVGRYGGTHPLLTRRGWVPAAEVCVSDEAAVALDLPDTEEVPVPDALIKVSAMLLCDGALRSDALTYTKTGASRAEYMRCLAELGVPFSERGLSRLGRAPYVQVSSAASSPLRDMLVAIGMDFVNSPERRVPPLLMGMSKRQIGVFLGGMWAGDGAAYVVVDRGREKAVVTFAGRSFSLCENVRDLLLRIGVPATLTASSVSYKGERVPYYATTVVGKKGKVDFLLRAISGEIAVGDRCSGRRTRAGNIPPSLLEVLRVAENMAERPTGPFPVRVEGPIWWVPVVKCSPDGEEMCYDIEVPEYHTFVAEGVVTHNTTSDLKWAKTEEELLCDPQMILYGSFVLGACDKQDIPTEEVETGHVVYLTRGARRARKTTVVLTREHLAREREKLEVTVDKMKVLALVRSPDEVPGEPNSCNNYGGCHFRDKCRALGLIGGPQTFAEYFREAPVPAPVNNNTTTTESPMSAIDPLAALKALKARNAAAAAARTEADTLPAKPSEPAAEAASSEEEQEVATTVATAPDPDKAAARAALFAKYGIKAPEGASAATVASAVLSAVATEEPKAPEAGEKAPRKPKGYAEKLAALGWTEAQVSRMTAEAMRAAIDGKLMGASYSVRNDGSIFEPGVGPVEGKAEEPETEKDASGDVKFVEKEAAPAPVAEPKKEAAAPAAEPALTLYIDCWPEKGRDRDYLLLEDIIAGYQEEVVALHNKSAKDSEKADYYTLIPYSRGPGYVAMLLLKAPPVGAVVCNTRYPGTNACLEVLVPLADVVIRSR